MLNIYKTIQDRMTQLDQIEDGCWINLVAPSEEELSIVTNTLNVEPTFLRAALDPEETSRIDDEDGQTLIIIDVPALEPGSTSV